jgi:hypothetical protein
MCHIVLFSPILALPLFLFLPIRTALPAYFAVVVAAGFIYFISITKIVKIWLELSRRYSFF